MDISWNERVLLSSIVERHWLPCSEKNKCIPCTPHAWRSIIASRLGNFSNRSGEFWVCKLIASTYAGSNRRNPHINNHQTCHQLLQALSLRGPSAFVSPVALIADRFQRVRSPLGLPTCAHSTAHNYASPLLETLRCKKNLELSGNERTLPPIILDWT